MEEVLNQMATPRDIVENLIVTCIYEIKFLSSMRAPLFQSKISVCSWALTLPSQVLLIFIFSQLTNSFSFLYLHAEQIRVISQKNYSNRLKVMCRITIMLYMSKMNEIELSSDL